MRVGNNLQKQVYINTDEIEKLKDTIKPEYNCSATLTSSSTSVAIASTNAPAGTKTGWLLTDDGLYFKITGGDDTNLLLEYYANLKGPQGESGAALNIDDSTTSATKVWSSQKTNNEIGNKIQNDTTGSPSTSKTYSQKVISDLESSGIAWTSTDIDGDSKVLLSVIYLGDQTALANVTLGGKPKLKVDDLVVYVDGNLNAKTLYRVSYIDLISVKATLIKVCDFAQGKQLYQHNIKIQATRSSYNLLGTITITNDSATPFTANTLISYLSNKGFTASTKLFTDVSGVVYIGQNYYLLGFAIISNNLRAHGTVDGSSSNNQYFTENDITLEDNNPIAL